MIFSIRYGKEFESRRIKNTLEKMSWYNENGYKPILPSGVSFDNIDALVEKEFVEEDFKIVKEKLKKELGELSEEFFVKIEELTKSKLFSEVEIFLTKYGTGGSYNLPNKIIIRIQKNFTLSCVVHEMIHLLVEDEIKKIGLNQKEKESFVKEIEEKLVTYYNRR